MKFTLESSYKPTGDQPQAIEKLVWGLEKGLKHQVLLGVTGSGKTFSMANIIQKWQKPTLVISHNKTLAAQLFQELREFFPKNAVSYFVSYYDYYQPEAYVPRSDTYIAKETEVNDLIDKLRLSATTSLLTRNDVIVVASVSCIYNLGSPLEYGKRLITLKRGQEFPQKRLVTDLIRLFYERQDFNFERAKFRLRGESIDIFPAWEDNPIKIIFENDTVSNIYRFELITGNKLEEFDQFVLFPAKHYLTPEERQESALSQIKDDLEKRIEEFKIQDKLVEAQRLKQITEYDLEMIQELGYCSGIENYSRYFDGRKPGDPPYTLLDYFNLKSPKEWLLIIDESHMTLPQIGGMYQGDRSRKNTLIDFGFRLPSALDNRPLTMNEFWQRSGQVIYTSATPAITELKLAKKEAQRSKTTIHQGIVEQLIRPTGLTDPKVDIRSTVDQIEDLIKEIDLRVQNKERVLVTTLTKRMSEDLSQYLKDKGVKVQYLHSEIETLKRSDILDSLRKGEFDVLVGINLLREGLDLPEVSLVAILDADKESFLRTDTALIQIMGRAARHIHGQVIMYADKVSLSMKKAIKEIDRRRKIQEEYNYQNKIIPQGIQKSIRPKLVDFVPENQETSEKILQSLKLGLNRNFKLKGKNALEKGLISFEDLKDSWMEILAPDRKKILKKLKSFMRQSAQNLNFEEAAKIRDLIRQLEND